MTERFLKTSPAGAARPWPRRPRTSTTCWTARRSPFARIGSWIGVAGTATTLAGVYLELAAVRPGAGARLDRSRPRQVDALLEQLSRLTVAEIRALPSMHPGRADVITGGTLIATRVAARTPVPEHARQRVRHPGRDRAGAAGSLTTGRMRGWTRWRSPWSGTTGPASSRGRPRCCRAYRMNLEDSSMTLLRGHFAMTLICAGEAEPGRPRAGPVAAVDASLAVSVRAVPDEDDPAPVGVHLPGDRARRRPAGHRRPAGRHHRRRRRQHHRPDHPADRRSSTCCVAEVDLPPAADVAALQARAGRRRPAELGVDSTLRQVENDEL